MTDYFKGILLALQGKVALSAEGDFDIALPLQNNSQSDEEFLNSIADEYAEVLEVLAS